jgi:Bacterial Ig domain/SprB repeat
MRLMGCGICAFVVIGALGRTAEAQPLTASITSTTNVSCNGGSNGSLTVTASGGSPPYTYSWAPSGGTAPTATGLSAGHYWVTVTDLLDDSVTTPMTGPGPGTVTQPSAISGTPFVTNVSCNGGSNGTATLTASGGTSPYTYAWSPSGGTNATATGLSAGSYSVMVTDANACTRNFTNIIVTQPSAIVLNAQSQTNIACNGGATGAAQTTAATGGVGPYTYDWTPGTPTGDGTTSVTGLTAGTWTNTVTDANGCTRNRQFTIVQPSALQLNAASQTNVACFGGANGAASTSAATGGTPPYTYNWTPGNPTGDGTTSVTGLSANVFTNTVTDANGCTFPLAFTITQPTALLSSGSQTNIACNAGSTGSAAVTVSGGTPGYTYSWAPSGGTAATASGLGAGTYTVTFTDANSCTGTRDFNLTEPTALALTPVSTEPSCHDGTNGTAAVSVAGGTPPYTYLWDPLGATTSAVSGLGAGAYDVTVTDANACTGEQSFSLGEPAAIVATVDAEDALCHGEASGGATVTASGGVGAFTYDWTPGTPTGDGTKTVTDLPAGSYGVMVTDENACSVTTPFTVDEPATLVASVPIITNVACFGGATGSLTGALAGGTPPYTYSWSPGGATTAVVPALAAGTYTLTGTDANGCEATINANVTEPTALVVSLASMTQVSCGETDDGRLTATVTGGAGAYSYDWTPGTPTGDGTLEISALEVGSYTLSVEDANQCTASGTFAVTAAVGDNDLPTALPSLVTTLESTAVPITLTGADADCDALTFAVVLGPTHGDLSGTPPNLIYTPTTGYSGGDAFTFTASDGSGTSTPATITLSVTLVNSPPVGNPQTLTTDEGVAVAFTLTAVDPDDDELTFTIVDSPSHGTLTGTSPSYTYTPANGYVGADTLTFVANDSHVDSAETTITLQIDAIPLPDAGVPDAATPDAAPTLPDALGSGLPDARNPGAGLDEYDIESCGCRVGAAQEGTPWILLALLCGPLALLVRRRR